MLQKAQRKKTLLSKFSFELSCEAVFLFFHLQHELRPMFLAYFVGLLAFQNEFQKKIRIQQRHHRVVEQTERVLEQTEAGLETGLKGGLGAGSEAGPILTSVFLSKT